MHPSRIVLGLSIVCIHCRVGQMIASRYMQDMSSQVTFIYNAFNNTNCVKSTAPGAHGKVVHCSQ